MYFCVETFLLNLNDLFVSWFFFNKTCNQVTPQKETMQIKREQSNWRCFHSPWYHWYFNHLWELYENCAI